jgi:arylsulfatase A-like enzyme
MSSRPSLRRGAAGAVVVPLLLALFLSEPSTRPARAEAGKKPNARPNVLIIVTDDQRLDTMDAMPKTRRWISKEAVSFKNAYATTPRCCPSRSSIMTGRYAHNHGVHQNFQGANLDHSSTLQRYLRDAGYTTAMLGKMLNSWDATISPKHFDRWALLDPMARGSNGYANGLFNINGKVRHVRKYSTDFISLKAKDFLTEFEARDDKPWYMYVAPYGPHSPFVPAERHRRTVVNPLESNPAIEESDVSDKPLWVQNMVPNPGKMRAIAVQQRRTLLSVDEMVAGLLQRMRKLDERRNTLVFFLSDNGYMWGEHRVRGKKSPYEYSVHVPFAMSWPARLPATSDDRLVANIDIAPTILDAARVTPPVDPPMDGRSILSGAPREELLLEFWQARGVPGWAAIAAPGYQFTEWHDGRGDPHFYEYYDMVADPWQLNNLLGDADPLNDPNRAELAARLAQYRACSGATCP